MKKMLVLALVLAVAGLANAGLILSGVDTYIASVASTDNNPYVANLVIQEPYFACPFGLTAAVTSMPGNLSFVTDFGNVTGGDINRPELGNIRVIQFSAASSTVGALQAGIHFTATLPVPLNPSFGYKVILMSEDFQTDYATLFVAPEPMTMGLLSLGALFLRKRK